MLHGHERSITQIKYNREGDLILTCGKDQKPNVWFSVNGERLGTFNGHQGAVWCIDVDWTSTKVITGSGDMSAKYVLLNHRLLLFAQWPFLNSTND